MSETEKQKGVWAYGKNFIHRRTRTQIVDKIWYVERDSAGELVRSHNSLPDGAEPLIRESELDAAKAEIEGLKVADERLALPTVKSPDDLTPEILRLAADALNIFSSDMWDMDHDRPSAVLVWGRMRVRADHLEAEQKAATEQDQLVEDMNEVFRTAWQEADADMAVGSPVEAGIEALLSDPRFTITRNEVK